MLTKLSKPIELSLYTPYVCHDLPQERHQPLEDYVGDADITFMDTLKAPARSKQSGLGLS